MTIPTMLFGLLLALCVVVGLSFVIVEVPFEDVLTGTGRVERVHVGHGITHSRFPSMDDGGPGDERHGPILWLAWTFGMLQLAVIVGSLMLGVKHVGRVRLWLAGCGVLLGGIFTTMVVTYQGYLGDATPTLFFSLPAPTAWFLYGFWPAQFCVVTLYALMFTRSIVTRQDMSRFHGILAERRRRPAGEA